MADVFVSYSREDSPIVTRLAGAIESGGRQVWIDTSGIEDTEVFPLAIRSAIESSDAFLFVISSASVASRFCEKQVDYPQSLNKRFVPVLRCRVPDDGSDFATGDAAGAVKISAECLACGDSGLLLHLAKSWVVSRLTPLEQAAKR